MPPRRVGGDSMVGGGNGSCVCLEGGKCGEGGVGQGKKVKRKKKTGVEGGHLS